MTPENRETIQRAIGIIEGVAFTSTEATQEALFAATEMLDSVLNDKEKENQI